MPLSATYDAPAQTIIIAPSQPFDQAVVYAVARRRPGKPDAVLPTVQNGDVGTTGPLPDGVYALVVTTHFPDTQDQDVVSPVLTVLADGQVLAVGSAAYDQRAADYLRAGRDGDRPLDRVLICFSRDYEAGALLAEGAPEAAHRILRQSLPPQH